VATPARGGSVTWVPTEPVSPRNAQLITSDHIRFHPMEVLCGNCGGLGCGYCEPEPEPQLSRRQLLRQLFKRKAIA
jgi:hypothetical protein